MSIDSKQSISMARRFLMISALGVGLLAPSWGAAQHMSIGEYRKLSEAAVTDKAAAGSVSFLLTGFWNMALATSDANVRLGAKPDFCLPRTAAPVDLKYELEAQLASGLQQWRPDGTVGHAVLVVMALRWPCK